MHWLTTLASGLALILGGRGLAASYQVDPAQSVLAVVTHRAGIAGMLAHDHLIVAQSYKAELNADPAALDQGTFKVTVPVSELRVDADTDHKQWIDRLTQLEVMSEPFSTLGSDDRADIRTNMLAADQMDGAQFKEIKVELVKLTPGASKVGQATFDRTATIRWLIHGKTVMHDIPAHVEAVGDTLRIEAVGSMNFTEFGIEPVSMLLGAIRNDDTFYTYAQLVAKRGST